MKTCVWGEKKKTQTKYETRDQERRQRGTAHFVLNNKTIRSAILSCGVTIMSHFTS